MTNIDENHLDSALQALSPRVGTIGYCRHCREAIIARETSRASVWTHRNSGLVMCEPRPATFATPELRGDDDAEPELERLRRLPDTAPLAPVQVAPGLTLPAWLADALGGIS